MNDWIIGRKEKVGIFEVKNGAKSLKMESLYWNIRKTENKPKTSGSITQVSEFCCLTFQLLTFGFLRFLKISTTYE